MKEAYSETTQPDGSIATIATGQESSVEIKENAKGEPQVSVKVYHADAVQAATDAVELYKDVIAKLRGLKR